jgi:hypothetical protein
VTILKVIGMVESLYKETAHLGVKTLLIEPGRFRTKLLSPTNLKRKVSTISEYTELSAKLLEGLALENGNQPGNVEKLVEITIDLVKGEGIAKGKQVPFRLPLGSDCFNDIKAKCEETLQLLAEWEDVIKSTDYDEEV